MGNSNRSVPTGHAFEGVVVAVSANGAFSSLRKGCKGVPCGASSKQVTLALASYGGSDPHEELETYPEHFNTLAPEIQECLRPKRRKGTTLIPATDEELELVGLAFEAETALSIEQQALLNEQRTLVMRCLRDLPRDERLVVLCEMTDGERDVLRLRLGWSGETYRHIRRRACNSLRRLIHDYSN